MGNKGGDSMIRSRDAPLRATGPPEIGEERGYD